MTKTIARFGGIIIALCLLAVSAFAQTAPAYPSYFVGAGASYNRYATGTPTAAGWTTAAVHLGSGVYSITTIDQTSTAASLRTGIAKIIAQTGNFTLMLHADGGVTTGTTATAASSSVALGSFSGGGLIMYDLGGLSAKLKGRGFYALGLVRILAISSAAVQPVYEFGFGKAF